MKQQILIPANTFQDGKDLKINGVLQRVFDHTKDNHFKIKSIIMENTVTIKLSEYEKLKNTFENSELKNSLERENSILRKEIENKNQALKRILNEDFIEVCISNVSISYSFSNSYYHFKKDKTPLWIKKYFNK